MPKKHKYSFIESEFKEYGYTLLSTEYVNNASPLEYVCPNGHKHDVRYNDWRRGVRCPECFRKTYSLKCRVDEVRKRYLLEGYILLSDNFDNNKSSVEVVCPQGHLFKQSIGRWMSGNRCPYCSKRVRLKDRVDEIKESLCNAGYIFVGFDRRKIKYTCSAGHSHSVLWTDWQHGVRCPYCSGNFRKTIEGVKIEFELEGYILLTNDYQNCFTKLYYICPKGHQRTTTWNDWQQGYRCRICANKVNSKRFSGSGHPNWKGGISCEPYCSDWTKEYKEYIKERDGHRCLNPDCRCKDSILTVHHIDYNKKNCKPTNLITLCRSCNSRANKDRSWHKSWYQTIINRRYGV